jgi:hypothetical protein
MVGRIPAVVDPRPHQHANRIALPEAQFGSRRTNDAGASWLHHFDPRALPQTELLQAMNLLRISHQLADLRGLSGAQTTERNQLKHIRNRLLGRSRSLNEIKSHYQPCILTSLSSIGNGRREKDFPCP